MHRVGVLHIAPALNEGQLLEIIIIAIRRRADIPALLALVVPSWQVRQLLLRFPHFIDALFFR